MTKEEFIELWSKYEDEYLNFEKVVIAFNERDYHAFHRLRFITSVKKNNVITSVSDNVIYLNYCIEDIIENVTEEDIIELQRAGVCYSTVYGCFYMFV